MERPQLAEDERFKTMEARKAHEEALDEIIAGWTSDKDAFEVMHSCQEAKVPAGVVQNCQDLFNDPQLKQRGHYVFLDHPEIGNHAYDANCFHLSESSPTYQPAPLLGEHTDWVCREVLGLSQDEIKELTESGVFA